MEIVNMPLSASENMVVGSLDLKRVFKDGIKALEPGIMARANRNILYIDEVNLLDDHQVNILLDASAMGHNIIERDGISLNHPARFIMVGTMNPEKGDLRPQILDRFGFEVDVKVLTGRADRLAVMRNRRAFDLDTRKFAEHYAISENDIALRIEKAKAIVPKIDLTDNVLQKMVTIVTSLEIRTHRADIVMKKTAVAFAALASCELVTDDDDARATLLAFPHRTRQMPFEREGSFTFESVMERMNIDYGQPLDDDNEQNTQRSNPRDEVYSIDREQTVKKIF
jgi:Mg-chelatase subunit ChlI